MTVAALVAAFALGVLAGVGGCHWWLALDVDAERNLLTLERERLARWGAELTARDIRSRTLDARGLHLAEQAATLAAVFDQEADG